MLLHWYACISTNTYYFETLNISLETDWWALPNTSSIVWIRSAVREILADKAFIATDVLISQSFVAAFVPPAYVQIALIWGFPVQLSLWKLVYWLWRYKLNEVCDISETYLKVITGTSGTYSIKYRLKLPLSGRIQIEVLFLLFSTYCQDHWQWISFLFPLFTLFYFSFFFFVYFLFLEQLGLGFISNAVTNWWHCHKTNYGMWEKEVKGSGMKWHHTVWTTHVDLILYTWSLG